MCEIPDLDLFMICERPNRLAFAEIPAGYRLRTCRKEELDAWIRLVIDKPEYYDFVAAFFREVYLPKGDLFFERCLLICDAQDAPVATCFIWKAYGRIHTIHWLKVAKALEGKGLGRAMLTACMRDLTPEEYPLFLHTHPSAYRAVKLYSDVGFALISAPAAIGNRPNDLQKALPYLEEYMPEADFRGLRFAEAPQWFLEIVASSDTDEF